MLGLTRATIGRSLGGGSRIGKKVEMQTQGGGSKSVTKGSTSVDQVIAYPVEKVDQRQSGSLYLLFCYVLLYERADSHA
jgi:hypothetical protein